MRTLGHNEKRVIQMKALRMKIPNHELLQIASGISHIVLEHESLWSLHEGFTDDKILSVRFTKPILKRPMTLRDKTLAVEYAKYRAHYWRVELFLDCVADDGSKYVEQSEIVTQEPAKLDDLNDLVKSTWDELTASVNPKHIRGRRWVARIIKGHERKAIV